MTTKKKLWLKISGPFFLEDMELEYSRYTIENGIITVCLKSEKFPEYHGRVKSTRKGTKKSFTPHGYGCCTIRNTNFNVYVSGEWVNGYLPEGEVKINDQLMYRGALQFLKPNGFGTSYFKDGTEKWIGIWKNAGIIRGTENYPSGKTKYEGFFHNSKFNGQGTLYQQNGDVKQEGIFDKGKLKISKQDLRKKVKSQQTIKKFMSTNNRQHLTQITKQEIKDYLEKHAKTQVDGTKQQLIQHLDTFRKQLLQQKQTNPKVDPITFQQIKHPVIADDGIIYDKSTLSQLFQKKQNGDYRNIPYIYNQKDERVPSYPRLAGGKPVTTFYTLEQLRENPSIQKRQQFLKKLETFS